MLKDNLCNDKKIDKHSMLPMIIELKIRAAFKDIITLARH